MREESPIFIVGMPHSGITLMRTSLASHPRIAIGPATHFLSYWMPSHATTELRDALDFERFWSAFAGSLQFRKLELDADALHDRLLADGVPTFKALFSTLLREHARRCGKPRWGEKTPAHHRHIGQLLEWYPNARIIYMLRDPRAVVASLLDAPWSSLDLEFHAARWRDSVRALRRWEDDERICTVHYEALVIDPKPVLRKVCAFLEERFDPALLALPDAGMDCRMNYHKWGRRHLSDALGPIRTDSLTKWQLRLTPDQVAIVEYLTRKGMLRYGYEVSSEGPGA
ncbi:MAG TPA: sulfotransferase, partial [Nitrococcus sp.]|nr:sulfotransferase [Nitrococcus sp.]